MIEHILLFLLVGWLVSLAYFAREASSLGGALVLASRKLLRYAAWAGLIALVLYGLQRLFIYPY